jgi:hypothetical protein
MAPALISLSYRVKTLLFVMETILSVNHKMTRGIWNLQAA